MSTTTDSNSRGSQQRHDGRNVKRIREILQVKQSTLAGALGEDWNQKKISQLEDKETIDDALMEEIASALKVPVEAIKNFDEEKATFVIQNNYDSATNNINYQFNPVDKIVQLYDEKVELLERLLQSEKEKVEMLQKIIDERK